MSAELSFVLSQYTSVTDGQTDRQTDRRLYDRLDHALHIKTKSVNQSGEINELVRKQGASCFILVAPSSEYEKISFSTVFDINCCLSVPKIIRFCPGV